MFLITKPTDYVEPSSIQDTMATPHWLTVMENLLKRTNMVNSRPCPTPAIIGNKFVTIDGDPLDNLTHYRSIIGAL